MINASTWIPHLIEFRRRLIICLISFGIILLPFLFYSNTLYHFIALPLLNSLPQGGKMIATGVTTPLIVPVKLAFSLTFFLLVPLILYQLWAFVTPALYQQEKQLIFPVLFFSIVLFYLGMSFAYFVVFPLLFHFFIRIAPSDVIVMTDIDAYLTFILKAFLSFGFVFEIPVLVFILIKTHIVSLTQLRQFRRYVIVLAFIIGMLIAPPDVLSQTLIALPIWLLYEVGMLISWFSQR